MSDNTRTMGNVKSIICKVLRYSKSCLGNTQTQLAQAYKLVGTLIVQKLLSVNLCAHMRYGLPITTKLQLLNSVVVNGCGLVGQA